MKKRIISVVLLLCMTVSAFAGCKAEESEEKKDPDISDKIEETPEKVPEDQEKPDEKPDPDQNKENDSKDPSTGEEDKPLFDDNSPVTLTSLVTNESKTLGEEEAKYLRELFSSDKWYGYTNNREFEYKIECGELELFFWPENEIADKANNRSLFVSSEIMDEITDILNNNFAVREIKFDTSVKIYGSSTNFKDEDKKIIADIFNGLVWKRINSGVNLNIGSVRLQFESIVSERNQEIGFYYSYDGYVRCDDYYLYATLDKETNKKLDGVLKKYGVDLRSTIKFTDRVKLFSNITRKADLLSADEIQILNDFLAGLDWRNQHYIYINGAYEVLASLTTTYRYDFEDVTYCRGGIIHDPNNNKYAILGKSERDFIVNFIETRIGDIDDFDMILATSHDIGKIDQSDEDFIMGLVDSDNWKYDTDICDYEYVLKIGQIEIYYCPCGKFTNGLHYSLTLDEADKNKVNGIIKDISEKAVAPYVDAVTVENVAEGLKKTLDANDAKILLDIFNATPRVYGNTGTSSEYLIKIGGSEIYYNLIGVGNDVSSAMRFSLSYDDRKTVDAILERYVGKAERHFSGLVSVDFFSLVNFTVSEEDSKKICDFYNSRTFVDREDCECFLSNAVYVSGYTFHFDQTSIDGPFGHASDMAYTVNQILLDYIHPDLFVFEGKVSAYTYEKYNPPLWLGDFSKAETEYLMDLLDGAKWKHNIEIVNLDTDFVFEIRIGFETLYMTNRCLYNPRTNKYVFLELAKLSQIIREGLVKNPDAEM